METAHGVGLRVRAIRRRRELTQAELAERIDRSVNALSALERGVSKPTFDTLLALGEALGVPIRDFFPPGGRADSPKHTALFSEIIDGARTLPPADLVPVADIVGLMARRCGG